VARVPDSTAEEMESAVRTSKEAFRTWSKTTILTRQQIMFNLQSLIRRDHDILAEIITNEQGKTLLDAKGDVFRGLRTCFTNTEIDSHVPLYGPIPRFDSYVPSIVWMTVSRGNFTLHMLILSNYYRLLC
jgi:acyl-CoA reductase-like NAD-dependent aldehyde dehydrogenase